ncbi:ribbon-helix-helix domain-containing protein [Enterocloster citroniae]|uniref:ribbon-helix-helix domain-containing protein n=1 Tax=Enterocloster citroniae TaxID=358743 RepID=UPI00349E4E88
MPTKKPRVQTILNEDIYEKFKILCDKEMRTESQMASIIITKYINDYEAQQNRAEQKGKLEKSSISRTG